MLFRSIQQFKCDVIRIISTDSIVGDKPLDNVIRLKPISSHHQDGEVMGIVTIITERYRVQYALVYTSKLEEAVTDISAAGLAQDRLLSRIREHKTFIANYR